MFIHNVFIFHLTPVSFSKRQKSTKNRESALIEADSLLIFFGMLWKE